MAQGGVDLGSGPSRPFVGGITCQTQKAKESRHSTAGWWRKAKESVSEIHESYRGEKVRKPTGTRFVISFSRKDSLSGHFMMLTSFLAATF